MNLRAILDSFRKGLRPAESKASRTAPLVALAGAGRPVWTPRDYAALAREGYARNPVVHRAVRMIAEAAASVPFTLFEDGAERDRHPLLDLLAAPGPGASRTSFLEEVYGHLMVAGNAYVEVVAIDGVPRELHALRPDRVRVVPGRDGWPEAYDYTLAGRSVRLGPREPGGRPPVLHLKVFHPLDDHYGFAPLEAAQVSLDLHNAAGAWNKALLDNSARPSGALVYGADGANLSEEAFERLKAELAEGYQGARNAGRPLLLDGGLDWKPMGLSPREMDFVGAKNQAAREIALAFGVPPMLLAIPGDNTFANYQEANRAFWRQTVLPLAARTAEALARFLAPDFGGGFGGGFEPEPSGRPAPGGGRLELRPDADAIEALAAERAALWERVERASFLTRAEKRIAVGYGPDAPDGLDGPQAPGPFPAAAREEDL